MFGGKSAKAYKVAQDEGVKVYNQAVLLRGVNDNLNTLVNLYNKKLHNLLL